MPRMHSVAHGDGMTNHEHCALCPIKHGEYCRGEQVKRFCELIDPACPKHDPGYALTVIETTAKWVARRNGTQAADYPSLLEMAGSAAAAAKRLAAAWWSGNEVTVSLEEMEERLATCVGCEHFDHQSTRCRKCGCWLKKKARLKTEHCPLDPPKW
jgi:Family of unknown function (DUF6171)